MIRYVLKTFLRSTLSVIKLDELFYKFKLHLIVVYKRDKSFIAYSKAKATNKPKKKGEGESTNV